MSEPINFTAGDTVKFKKSLPAYPASAGWSLSYVAINLSGKFTGTGVASGDDHEVTISATASANIAPGVYTWETYVSKSGERFRVGSGSVEVKPNISTASVYDGRSHARKTLDAIEAVIQGRASADQEEYTIGNRSLKRTPIADLIVLADRYRAMVRSEENAEAVAQGRGTKNKILVRF